MNTADLQFNIIFTPNTVAYLSPLLHSLLEWTDCSYRIVNNGCGAAEQALLETLCADDARLEYLNLSPDRMILHGEALGLLLESTDSPWFCFLDSDIMATGPYLQRIVEYLEECDVFSTGLPLWHSPAEISLPPEYRCLHGIHFGTTDGRTLGGTYFAVYKSDVLRDAMARTGVDMRIYRWRDVPERHRSTLASHKLDKLEYDTGMLLMALMYADGVRFAVADLEHVVHLGGFSSRADDATTYYSRGTADRLAVGLFRGALAGPLLYLADTWYAFVRPSPGVNSGEDCSSLPFAERRQIEGRIRKRRNTARYFKALMRAAAEGAPLPRIPVLGYRPAERRLAKATTALLNLYKKYPPPQPPDAAGTAAAGD